MKTLMKLGVTPWVTTALVVLILNMPQAFANPYYYDSYNPPGTAVGRYFDRHPIVKKAAVGAGAGAVVGGLLGGKNWGRGAVKGALIGGLAGTAWGYAQDRGYLGGNSPRYYSNGIGYGVRPQNAYYRY